MGWRGLLVMAIGKELCHPHNEKMGRVGCGRVWKKKRVQAKKYQVKVEDLHYHHWL